ncbi:hypothetical protein B0A72_08415 [Flavobacterium pectinovorum]|uniref:HYR domain-containing protein n=3 Tax=Flavobacterium pectinovorum TaxID=29533 RepID=A0AB36P2U6_9FLAO|nr:hypothetical protein B0A72_08415 [Flavobacterium pectinovorum]
MISYNASAQFYTKHYIAPAPWQYFSKANEIVIATNSTATVNITVSKSDGTVVTTLIASKGAPAIYRFAGKPSAAPAFTFNTVLNAAGLIVTGSAPISINLRNVASDALGGDGSDQDIKGNAALTSFGDAGIGIRFRVGYYRDGSLGNFNNYGDQRPIYSVMAITNGTTVTIGGVITATLNAGQSYLFKATIGTLVETSNPSVMNTSAFIDTPNGCGDGAFNQIPPEAVLGSEYFIERGKGNDTAEQTTVIATKPNTKVIVDTYSVTGALVSTKTTTLATAGSFFTFLNGVSGANFSASRVSADNNVVVYSGTAQSCEVDISTIAPVSECGGSKFIETAKFRNYGTGSLPYFGYVLLKDAVAKVYVNGVDIETKSGVSARHQLGATGWYLINFEDTQIGSPDVLSISSDAKLTVSIVQQGGGFSMAGFFSNFAVQPEDPTLSYIAGGGCTNSTAILSTPTGFVPYQWYFNGTAISGATSNTYTATKTGSYSVASTLTCGAQTQSKPVSVTLCTDLGVTKTVDNTTPCVGSNVEFTVTLSNLGVNNATGVSVNDLLPTGYTFVSSTPSVGTYNSGTGVWSIGDINGGIAVTLKIVAKVNASGAYTNTAVIPASVLDTNSANNSASISTTPNPLPTASINGTLTACYTTTLTAVTNAGSPAYVWYKDNVVISGQISSTLVVTVDGDYKVKVTNTATTCENTSAVSTVKVSDTQKPTITCPSNVTAVADANSCAATGVVLGTPTTTDNCTGTITVTNNAPSSFPIGITTVTWTAKDASGNTQTCTQTVTVSDTQKPTITCPSNVTVVADVNSCAATGVVLGTPTTTDNCTGTITVTNNAPSSFPIGITTVTWTAKDASGNTQTCTQTVTVSDTQKPTITCPSNVTAVADVNSCAATGVVLGTPTTTDNCTGTITVTNNAPSSFPIGITTVTWTAKDAAGNTQTCTQTVTVSDTQKPTITCPSNVTAVADVNSCAATGVVLGTPTTTDNCTGAITVTNNAPSSFPIGITTVTWTAKDAAGNTQTCTQTVTVSDTQKPTITCPSNVTAVANANSCAATGVVLGTPTTTDNCTGTITVTNNAPSSFPIGITTVTWTAKDASGNTQTCTQTVTVSDTQKPTITCPSNVTVVADVNSCATTGVVLGTPTTTDNCTGAITVTNNAPSSFPIGVTTVTWTAKDASGNTQTCTQMVKVVGPIKANDDIISSFNGFSGGVAVSNVLSNDLLNCNAAITSDVNLTLASTLPSVLTFNTTTGSVTVNPKTPAGTYLFDYTICEKSNTTNCSTASVKITVVAPVIDAVTETTTSINGNTGGTTTESVITNDTLNGNPVVIGTNPGEVKLTGITFPTGLTLNADGTVTVAVNTAAGNYNVEYSICEITNPTNCDSVISVVVVGKPIIDAVTETTASINGNAGGTTAESVITNDTLNGNPVVIGTNPGEVKLTGITVPTGFVLNTDGTVTVAANTAAGNYNIEYSICEITNQTNCDSVISVVVVGKPTIDAVTETTASINGNTGGTTISLVNNDTLNGNPVVIGTNPGEVKLTGISVPTGLTLNADGTVTVAANTAAGNYNVEYSICEITNPTNCDSVISMVVVGKPTIDAVTETTASINGNTGGTTISLVNNDTLNGNPVVIGTNPGEVKLTGITVPTGLTLNANGTVTVAANTAAGNYNVEYSICEITNPTNCDSVISVVVVGKPTIDAVTETTASINGNAGGTTAESVITNDTLNGNPIVIGTNPGEVKLTGITVPTGLTLNANGTVTVAANTAAGNYNVEYSICEITNPTNCDSVISVVVVGKPAIDAVTETTASINGNTGGTTALLTANDTLNGNPVVIGTNPGEVKLTGITVPTGLTLNTDGTVTVAANTAAGNYNVEYSICEITNPTNCDSVISVVVVGKPAIDAVTETTASINGNTGGTTALLTANDTLNGNPVVIGTNPGEVKLTGITVPTGLTLNTDGTVTVAVNTAAGNYNVEYRICEITNPTNCDSVISVIVVGKPTIDAVTETTASINGNMGGTTTESVITNDTLNGNPIVIGTNPGEVKLTGITVPTGLTLNANGTVTVAANTAAGNYNVEYSICEITNPTNCDSVISVVVVGKPTIDAVTETTASINGNAGGITISLVNNDTLNGNPVVIGTNPGEVKLTGITVPTGLTLNADGTVTVAANTAAGNYNVEYSICEITNPTNCDSVISVVVVGKPAIDAVTETTASINGNAGGTTAESVITNDTLNGNPVVIGTNPGEVKLTGITVPTGLTLNADGTVTVAANTPENDYEIEYSICEITNPTNCDVVKSIVTVTGGVLIANPDEVASVVATNQPQTVVNVFDNDTNNGIAVVPNDVNLTIATADPTGFLTLNPDGTVTLGGNAPSGIYEIVYQICEKLNPTNCSSASVKVTVGTPVINAVEETTTAVVNGVLGGTTESLIANDTLNGNLVIIGTNPGEVKLSAVTLPTGFVLNSDGTVTVPANTPAGNYNVEYKICEINNPTNCDSATSIIVVTGGVLIANPDAVVSVVATNQPQTVVNVFDNDTNNSIALVPNDVNLTIVTADPTGFLTLNPDGTVTLGANAPSGTYEIVYQICEKLNPSNCSSASVKVTVGTPVIDAVEETTAAVVNGVLGGTTESLIANDTLNGNPVVIGTNPGEIKLSGVMLPTGFVLNSDGTITVPASTPAGNYNVEYKICEINNPTNCDSATSIIVVTGGVLIANLDAGALVVATNQPQTVVNVFDNDTNNGIALVPNDVNLTIVTADPTGFLTLNPDGTVTLGANAPSGIYEIVYQICEKLNPTNCSSASVKVTVGTPVINAVEETTTAVVNGVVGGTTESLIANDTLNGNPVVIGTNPGEIKLSAVTLPTGFLLNADGTVTVPASTPAGNYNVEYRICEINNPTNCDSATSIIVVTGGVLIANLDAGALVVATNQPQTVVNVFDNDTNNGIAVVPNDVNLTIVTADPTGFLTLNPDGTVTLGANAPSGIYEIVYQICEKLNPANCSSASVKVTVGTPVINAVEETTTAVVNGVLGGTTESLIANDTLNGNPVVIGTNPGEVKLSAVTFPTGFVLNADGTVTVPANTPAGNYNVEYKICEINNPTNCDSATSIIVVTGDGLQANPDVIPSVVESKLPQVLVNVFDNDTNNGIAVVPNDLNLTIVTADPTGFLTVGSDGVVNLGANAPSGTYELTYQICEKLDSKNCSQAIVRVKVNAVMPVTPATPIVANNDGQVFVDGINGQLAFINILDNDLLNGLPVNESDVVISNTPNSYFEFNSDGTVNVLPNTPGGSYTLTYQICEKANSTNCATATLSVFVEVPAIAIIKTAIFNDENKDGYANAGETITYKFKITNTGNVPLMKIIVSDLLPGIILSGDAIDLGVNESDENNFTAIYKINQSDINGGSVSNQAIVQGKSAAGVVVEDKSDDSNNMEDKPTVLPLNGCQITVLNGFSPNGDSKNERFYIQGLECYPENTVEIYNRWGVLVFDIDHYNNEDRAFFGYSAGRTTMKQSEGLPVGTYFYILKYRDSESNQHEKSGYLYINK